MKGLLDSSSVLRYLLNQDPCLEASRTWSWVGASELLTVECHRVLERVRFQKEISQDQYLKCLTWLNQFFEGINLIPINSSIIRRASRPFPVLLKTLDALHLATLEYIAEEEPASDWGFLTSDRQLGQAAELLGYHTF